MPLYEYQCGKCSHRFEKIQKFTDPAPEACPACGGGPVAKLPSSPAIQFKGTGWYITDYAKKSGTDAGKTGSAEKSDGGSSNSASESKSDAKTDSGGKSDSGAAPAAASSSTPAPAAAKDTKSN